MAFCSQRFPARVQSHTENSIGVPLTPSICGSQWESNLETECEQRKWIMRLSFVRFPWDIFFFFLRRLISEKTVQPYNVDYDNQSASGTLPANGSPSSRPSSYLSARGSSPGDDRPTLRISYIEDEENTINTEDLPIGDIRTYDTTRLETISLDSNDSQHQSDTRKWCFSHHSTWLNTCIACANRRVFVYEVKYKPTTLWFFQCTNH